MGRLNLSHPPILIPIVVVAAAGFAISYYYDDDMSWGYAIVIESESDLAIRV